MLPYVANETLQVCLNWDFWDKEIILDYLGKPIQLEKTLQVKELKGV